MSRKKKLASLLTTEMETLGYKLDLGDETLIYRKKVCGKFLSLGCSFYRFEPDKYYFDFYLSDSCIFALIFPDFPSEGYKRFTEFLVTEEMKLLQLDELGFIDLKESNQDYIKTLIYLLNKAENRFLDQDNLIEKIDSSQDLSERNKLVNHVFNTWKKERESIKIEYNSYIPQTKIKEVKELAYIAMNFLNEINYKYINKEIVNDLALDAYRRNLIQYN